MNSTYIGLCTVYKMVKSVASNESITFIPTATVMNEPCRLSFGKPYTTNAQVDGSSKITQDLKIFIAPYVEIPPGCRIDVVQNGVTYECKASGFPATYKSHQEIAVDLLKRRA